MGITKNGGRFEYWNVSNDPFLGDKVKLLAIQKDDHIVSPVATPA